jgi:D-3-phosphoglycerate dehydrogenase
MSDPVPRVVVIDDGYTDYEAERAALASVGARLDVRACGGDAASLLHELDDAQVLLVRESRIDAAAMAALPRLRGIVRYGIGVDNIDLAAAAQRRLFVANVPDYGTEEVADQALALLLAVVRRVATRDAAVRAGAWNVAAREPMYRIAGKTLGLVGYGRIARAVERRLRGFGVERVLVHDPFAGSLPAGVQAVTLDALCQDSDFISLHAPLTPQTRHAIDARRLALMRPTAVLVNTARGPLIDEAALADALRRGALLGAGLDVFEHEPLPAASPLHGLANVVLSDHTGWYSQESVRDLQAKAAAQAVRMLRGEPPLHWLNPWTTEEGTLQ